MADPEYNGRDAVLVGVHEGSQDCLVEVDMGNGDVRRLQVAPAQVYAVSYGWCLGTQVLFGRVRDQRPRGVGLLEARAEKANTLQAERVESAKMEEHVMEMQTRRMEHERQVFVALDLAQSPGLAIHMHIVGRAAKNQEHELKTREMQLKHEIEMERLQKESELENAKVVFFQFSSLQTLR